MAAILVLPAPALADDDPESDETKSSKSEVETSIIMVTAARHEQDLSEVPMSVSVVGETELRRNPTTDVATQLSQLPGVQLWGQSGGGANRRIMIRGFGANRTLILVDGIRQPELRGIDGSYFNIDPANIERIEVIKGPASVMYGSSAVGGVINIITKKGGADAKPVNFYTGFVADSSTDSIELKAAIDGAYQGFFYRLSGSGVDADDRRIPGGRLWHSAFTQRQYSGNLGYEWDFGRLEFSFDDYQGTYDSIPTANINGMQQPVDPWSRPALTSVTETPVSDRSNYTGKLVLNDLGDYLKKLTFTGYVQSNRRETNSIATFNHATYSKGSKISSAHNDHNVLGGAAQSEWQFGDSHFVVLGVDYDKTDFNAFGYSFTASGIKTKTTDVREGYQETLDFFAQDDWSLTPDLTATLGLRYTSVETALTKYVRFPQYVGSSQDSHTVGSLGLVYSGFDNLALRALYSQGYRTGNILQKFMGSTSAMMTMLPNPGLKPETSDNYELGLRYDNGALMVDLALFYNEMKDGLASVQVDPNDDTIYQYINFDKMSSAGVELSAEYRIPGTGFTPYGSLTLMDYRTENSRTGLKTSHNGRPSHFGNLGLKWETDLTDDLLLFTDANVFMTGGAHNESTSAATGLRTGSTWRPPYQIANFTVGVEGQSDFCKYNSTLSFRNLFNQDYKPISPTNSQEPGFHVVWSVGLQF